MLSVLAAVFLSIFSLYSAAIPTLSLRLFDKFENDCIYSIGGFAGTYSVTSFVECANGLAPGLLLAVATAPVVVGGLFALGSIMQRLVRRLVRLSLEELQQVDERAPILFLRAFGDDQVPLRPEKAPIFTRLIELGRRHTSLDQVLLEEGTPHGPVIALGNPNDRRPPYGAARGYFADKDWQGAVADLAHRARVIVICLDDTDGIWWEIDHLASKGHLQKTLFLLHPKFAQTDAGCEILTRVFRSIGTASADGLLQPAASAGKGRPQGAIGFSIGKDGAPRMVWSSTFSRLAFLLTLRMFLLQEPGSARR